jgi:hypothetical protein
MLQRMQPLTVRVVRELDRWPGVIELLVTAEPGQQPAPGVRAAAGAGLGQLRALAYPALVGEPGPGDVLLANANAVTLGLGTGGHLLVVASVSNPLLGVGERGPGHVIKGRYLPHQLATLAVDEPASPHRAAMAAASSLDGLPVVTCGLHSALPAVLVGIRSVRPEAVVGYVMTDGAALPAWYSRTVPTLRSAGWLAGTITTGQSFGGDLEAVTLHSGLLAGYAVLAADILVVAPGPGGVGTGGAWSFTGLAAGEAVNAAAILGGRPVGVLRMSAADPRDRHRGISHHSLTAYGKVALQPADLVLPEPLPPAIRRQTQQLAAAHFAHHRLITVDAAALLPALRRAPVPLTSMGRGLDDDPVMFLAAAAAGVHAAQLTVG